MKYDNKFKVSFFCLVAYLIIQPAVASKYVMLNSILLYGLTIILLLSPYLISKSKKWLIFGLVTVVLTIGSALFNYDNDYFFYLTNIVSLIAYFVVISFLFQYIISQKKITNDLIYASLLGYFMIAIGFGQSYIVLNKLDYLKLGPAEIFINEANWNYFYYSFTTLTTLGYGDIIPISPLAKSLSVIEATTGILYIAIFVGKLIGESSVKKYD